MKRSSGRRSFLQAAGATAILPWTRALAAPITPDLIVHNARIHTMERQRPTATAFAVMDGRFVAVGSDEEIKALAGRGTQLLDARRMTIVPGFIDAHCHPDGETLLYETLVGNPFDAELVTIPQIIEKLRQKAARTPPGYWVEGFYFDDTKVKGGQPLTKQDLDQVSRDHPVMVRHRGSHTAYANSKAFEVAGIARSTPNPRGGTYDRDAQGELTGRVTDNAMWEMFKTGQRPAFTEAQQLERFVAGTARMSEMFVKYGLTSVAHSGGDLHGLQLARKKGLLRHRIYYEAWSSTLDAIIASGLDSGFGDEWLRLGATFEHPVDGSFSERTAALSMPYPGRSKDGGNIMWTQAELDAWVERVHRAGIQVNCHANGDIAIDMTLKALERAQQLFPQPDARPKITHCTVINDDLVRRIKALGAIPAPFTTYCYYNADKFEFYGPEILEHCMAFRTFLDAGIPACAGSDFPPGPFSPLMGIQGIVTRKGWTGKVWGANQRVSVDEALRIYTINGAHASREEAIKGSIAPGKLADFVMLAEDPHEVDPDKIKDISIVRTVTGGRTVYEA